ncbi:MAG: hypothetical protein RMY28_033390 [Nostoc sp. ChiSLP01]|nr:hypothetical protein [Nostoc sp. CmiSLP01]MDZ8287662.1 hypothetical protein [Nostoc sp. ChiSLP01]
MDIGKGESVEELICVLPNILMQMPRMEIVVAVLSQLMAMFSQTISKKTLKISEGVKASRLKVHRFLHYRDFLSGNNQSILNRQH